MKITNKEKQYFGGNWGKPNKTEQAKGIPKDFGIDDPPPKHYSKKKKKKQEKKPWPWNCCAFCGVELPIDEEAKKDSPRPSWWIWREPRMKVCSCGAKVVPDCPCCHRDTWFKDEIYKHQPKAYSWCTFEGKRKELGNDKESKSKNP